MRFNLNYFTPLLTVFLLVIAGCSGGTGSGGNLQAFVGGSEGLSLAFMEGAPPSYVYDNSNQMQYSVQVKIENKGEYPVQAGKYKVNIVGVDPKEFGLDSGTGGSESIDAIRKDIDGNTIPGGITYWTYNSNGYIGSVAGDTTYNVRADICYAYGLKSQAMLCVKKDLFDTDKDKNPVCLVSEEKSPANSGSPISISSLKEEPGGNNKIRFTFTVSHRGTGLISSDAAACSDDLKYKDKVTVKVDTGMPSPPSCTFGGTNTGASGEITLFNGMRTITCTQDIPQNTLDFTKVVNIEVTYNYKDHISQALTVKHVG